MAKTTHTHTQLIHIIHSYFQTSIMCLYNTYNMYKINLLYEWTQPEYFL